MVHGKSGLGWPQIGLGVFFPTNPDLAIILGRTDLDFENFYFFDFLDPKFLDFRVPGFQITRNLAWARLGPGLGAAWAQLGGPMGPIQPLWAALFSRLPARVFTLAQPFKSSSLNPAQA